MLGSSLVVQPAAGFISNFTGDNLVIINRDATSYDRQADLVIHNDMTEVVEEVFKNKYKVQKLEFYESLAFIAKKHFSKLKSALNISVEHKLLTQFAYKLVSKQVCNNSSINVLRIVENDVLLRPGFYVLSYVGHELIDLRVLKNLCIQDLLLIMHVRFRDG